MLKKLIVLGAFAAIGAVQSAHAATVGTYGDVVATSSGYQLTSDSAGAGYAGLYYTESGSITPTSLTTLSADYQMTQGAFGGGAARFSIIDTTSNPNNEAYVYFGTPVGGGTFTDPASGAPGSTGNYADLTSLDARVQVNGFGGYTTGAGYETWDQFIASGAGSVAIGYVTLDLDGGFTGTQQMQVNSFDVNGQSLAPTAVPLPATLQCGAMLLGGSGILTLRRRRARTAA